MDTGTQIFVLVAKYFYVPMLAITFYYGWRWYHLARKAYPDWTDDLEKRHGGIRNALIFWGSIPWVIVAAGILTGEQPTIFGYLTLQAAGFFTYAFYGSVILIDAVMLNALYRKNGLEILKEPPGLEPFMYRRHPFVKIPPVFVGPLIVATHVMFFFLLFTQNPDISLSDMIFSEDQLEEMRND